MSEAEAEVESRERAGGGDETKVAVHSTSHVSTATEDTLFQERDTHVLTHVLVSSQVLFVCCTSALRANKASWSPQITSHLLMLIMTVLCVCLLTAVSRLGVWDELCSSCLDPARP